MRTMVCEVCGATDFVKRDGEYVCGGCGMRYSPADALGLFGDSDAVPASRADWRVKNYLDLAIQSKNAGNYFESEYYCNKALELDSGSHLAWRTKAEAVARQTTPEADRVVEAIAHCAKALETAPEGLRQNVRTELGKVILSVVESRNQLVASRYASLPTTASGNEVLSVPAYVADRDARLREALGVSIASDTMRLAVSQLMHNSANHAFFDHVLPDYASDGHRDKAAMDAFVEGGDLAISVIRAGIGYAPEGEKGVAISYGCMCQIQEHLVDAHSMRLDGDRWVRAYSLSEEDKARRRGDIAAWRAEAERIDPGVIGRLEQRPTPQRPAPHAEAVPAPDEGEGAKRGVLHRRFTWKMAVAFLCFARFLTLLSAPRPGGAFETLVWLGLGIAFVVWWYQTT